MQAWTLLSNLVAARWRFTRLHGSAIEAYQDRLARAAVAHAVQRSPYYRQLFAGHELADWRCLPTTDKSAMMSNFSAFNTCGVRLDDAMAIALRAEQERDFRPTINGLTAGLSSGTSGHRGLFLVSAQEQAAWAGFLLARTIPRFRLRGYGVAFFLRSNSNLYETLGSRWLRFRYFDLMAPLEQSIEALNREPPDFLVGPPSLLGMLADAKQEGRLRVRPERVISVAEVLEPQDRERLVNVFHAPVHQIYQCTEGLLAISCSQGSLHVQEDLVAVQLEPLAGDAEGRCTPIVTDLWRRTQPILRYRLNDVLTVDRARCGCGSSFRVLSSIEGRCDDVVHLVHRDGRLRAFFPDTIRRMILLGSPVIIDYLVQQDRPGTFRIYLKLASGADFDATTEAVQRSVDAIAASYECLPPTVHWVAGLPPLLPGRKRRRVQRVASDPA